MSYKNDKYHDLRQKLGIDQLDEKARKEMLEKLKRAGGKVDFSLLDKNSKSGYGIFQRNNQSNVNSDIIEGQKKRKRVESPSYYKYKEESFKNFKKIEKKLDTEKKIIQKVDQLNKSSPIKIEKKEKIVEKNQTEESKDKSSNIRNLSLSITDRILFTFNGYFFKVLSFKISKLHQDFLVNFFPHFASLISKLGYFIRGCFNNPIIKKKVRDTLGKLSPLHYDIIHQFLNLADDDYLSNFYEKSFGDFSAILDESEFEKFSFYFKKLLFIKEHSGVFEISLLTVRNIYLQYYRLNISEQELINDISFLITTAYEKFHILFCRNIGKYISFNSPHIKDFINFDKTDSIGYYFQKEKNEEEKALAEMMKKNKDKKEMIEEDIEKKEVAKIPDDVKKGFEFMDEIQNTFNKYKEDIIQNDGILQRLKVNDKITLTYIFYKELNEQYTTFMTLKEIGYKIDYEEHKKIDVKSELNNVLNSLNLLYQDFESYAESSLKTKIKSEQTFYDETLKADKEEMVKLSVSIRNKLIEILQSFLIVIMKVIKDYTDKKFHIIDNPDEKLFIDEKLHGVKKLNGKPIIYIFTKAYYFIKAFIYRLEKTDLSGLKIEIDEIEKDEEE
ncbi:MAG: hypothetical protein NUV32_04050 [Exilispira sp.]|jgi:hypothetical protein|nr:hypothetical protein [Exilispira sp.]